MNKNSDVDNRLTLCIKPTAVLLNNLSITSVQDGRRSGAQRKKPREHEGEGLYAKHGTGQTGHIYRR